MPNEMIVDMSMGTADGKVFVSPRVTITKIVKVTEIENGEQFASPNSVKDILKDIKDDPKHAFHFEWKPGQHASVFTNLKKNKGKFNIHISFLLRDGNGKNLFLASGVGKDATAKDAVGFGKTRDGEQKVKVECATFETLSKNI